MPIKYALTGLDGEVLAVADTVEEFSEEESTLFNIVKFNYNDSDITEKGLSIKAKILEKIKRDGLKYLRLNKQVGFYELSVDERYALIWKLLNLTTKDLEWAELDGSLEYFRL